MAGSKAGSESAHMARTRYMVKSCGGVTWGCPISAASCSVIIAVFPFTVAEATRTRGVRIRKSSSQPGGHEKRRSGKSIETQQNQTDQQCRQCVGRRQRVKTLRKNAAWFKVRYEPRIAPTLCRGSNSHRSNASRHCAPAHPKKPKQDKSNQRRRELSQGRGVM
jgi:hypothetical protein